MQEANGPSQGSQMHDADWRHRTLQTAVALHQQGKLVDARSLYDDLLHADPNNFDVLHLFGLIAYQSGKLAEAESLFIRAMRVKSDFAPLYSNFASVLIELKRFDEAIDRCGQAIAMQPDLPEAYFNRAVGLKALQCFEQALSDLDFAISRNPRYAAAFHERGGVLVLLERFAEAVRSYEQAISLKPDFADAYMKLGHALHARGRYEDAVAVYDRAIVNRACDYSTYYNRGLVLQALERFEDAIESYGEAMTLNPRDHLSCFNRGNAFKSLGRFDEALFSYTRAIALKPDFGEAYLNRGVALHELRRFSEALGSFDQAVLLRPDDARAMNNRGVTLRELGAFEQALVCFDRAIAFKENYAEALNNRGNALRDLRRFDEAIASFEKAIAMRPDYAEAFNNKGNALKDMMRWRQALGCYDKAISLKPDYAEAFSNRGNIFRSLRRFDEALASYDEAVRIDPKHAEALNNRANTLKDLKRFDEALATYAKAIEAEPMFFYAHSNMLFTLNYLEKVSVEARVAEARRFGENAARSTKGKYRSWDVHAATDKLRVGFVSGDFRNHPVGFFLENVVSNLDQSRLELFAYSSNDAADDLTLRLKDKFSSWKSLAGIYDSECARMIHADGVQVLIDLSGHTAFNRLLVFAFKPAPVQAAWLGYFATTGVAEMDYILGDPWVTPVGEEHHFCEKIKRLPETYFCFTPPADEIGVEMLPALKNGYVTFGCFNNFAKINDAVIGLWAQVLRAVEGSRLFLKAAQLDDLQTVRATEDQFRALGVSSDRLIFEGQTSRTDNFKAYNRVDIALDPFPYPGGTTSVEALWMGVPVITRKGACFVSHNGETIAHNSGQSDWIARDEDEYVQKAVRFSSDLQALSQLRLGLRRQIVSAPLFDAPRFARHFENALFEMWEDYKKGGEPSHA